MRFRKSIICPECGADTFYHRMGKCVRCYERVQRDTPEYQEKRRLYYKKNRERIREVQKRFREKYLSKKRTKPLRRRKPLPRPTKRIRAVSNNPRKRDIRRKDREFQESIPENARCAVGKDCVGQLVKHHLRRRRYLAGRWDDRNALILCAWHHQVVHQLGEKQFLEKNPQVEKRLLPGSE